ncbi:hypothetical protein BN8_05039 [Fibrisoma limi BUZ 3]|uniref:DNA mimic protein DMP19 C-terminal domain-containing protein n=1 Tax=Fibrisoma limi BUZ 3 TaxID=1185876 RepID=I2GPC6_9BACT|nr:DUF4375 domain-containing protein [Fibrisoma limi]CCH55754.1 hypothetical protein BN8_05039 [Fibrisoma limi BUZ 3]
MGIPNRTLSDYQQAWEKLVDKGFSNYESMTPAERIWFNLQTLLDTVDNGGLISHYYNTDADRNRETIEDLIVFGFPELADLLLSINAWFPGGHPSLDIEERNDAISNWAEGQYDSLLEEFDNRFYAMETALESALVNHIEQKGLN